MASAPSERAATTGASSVLDQVLSRDYCPGHVLCQIQVGSECTAPIQLDTGTVQESVLFPPLFDLFLNALLRLLDATDITHGVRGIPQWNHAAFADDLTIYVCTVRDGNHIRVYCQGRQQISGRGSRVRGLERAPHLNPEVASHGSNARHWIGKAIREGKNRHSREEKISMTGHLEFPNPCPRGHG